MFKKLRNKFLILNLVIISIAMMIAFGSIYLITYNNVHREIDKELGKISEFNKRPDEMPREPKPGFEDGDLRPERSFSFSIILDNNNAIIYSSSMLDLDRDFYERAKNDALAENSSRGKFKLDGTHWAFMKSLSKDGLRIVFLDVTSRQSILTNLIYTFPQLLWLCLLLSTL